MAIILIAECDLAVVDVQQAIIREGHAMRITTDIVQHLLGSGERALGVDHPFDGASGSQVAKEGTTLAQWLQRGKESQFTGVVGLDEIFQKQAAEQTREDPNGQEKSGTAGDPLGPVGREPAARDDTMQMRMME